MMRLFLLVSKRLEFCRAILIVDPGYTPGTSGRAHPSIGPFAGNGDDDDDVDHFINDSYRDDNSQ